MITSDSAIQKFALLPKNFFEIIAVKYWKKLSRVADLNDFRLNYLWCFIDVFEKKVFGL